MDKEMKIGNGEEECICCGRRNMGRVVIDNDSISTEQTGCKFVVVTVIDEENPTNLLLSTFKDILVCPACFAHGRHKTMRR
jgi:hypothetical protein